MLITGASATKLYLISNIGTILPVPIVIDTLQLSVAIDEIPLFDEIPLSLGIYHGSRPFSIVAYNYKFYIRHIVCIYKS